MKALSILHVEDNQNDAMLVRSMLDTAGIKTRIHRVDTEEAFNTGLREPELDLIISDFSMPHFNGLAALRIARKTRPDVPFIFVSGTIGEEAAIESLKEGATDYVIKDRMSRLAASVQRAIRDAAEMIERRRMETRIREQAALLDRARDAICLVDMSHKILYWNKSAERVYGWRAFEALGKTTDELLFVEGGSNPSDALRSLIRKGEWMGELHQVTKDRREIIMESRWTLMRDERDEPASILVINTDVTEKKRIESQLLRTQRMETIGALAGGIAHDLNNALSPVLMAGTLLRKEISTPEGNRLLDMMSASAKRGIDMVKQILQFSRGVSGDHQAMNVKPIIEEMSLLATKTFPRSIKIETKIADNLPKITANATQMHQVLLNLCVNARDAMPKGGSITISAENANLDKTSLPVGHDLHPGQFVIITVADTGQGIPPAIRQKIFEPFFTTKEVGRGTGLGLSTVMGIIKTHGGFVDLITEEGRGTTFKVCIPASKLHSKANSAS